ncbi:MAG: NAD(P)-dependent oxidoreductase [Hylemonella sp.]|nr:NAD(P)-dependent oxidoreductase [Hylemonella sp.]
MSESPSVRIGIIGLGIMGGTMARALLAAGYQVFGYDVDPARMRALRRAGGTPMPGYAELASQADALITSLPSAQALHDVVAALQGVKPRKRGQVLLETSTLPLADKEQADTALRSQGRVMLDAPISGTATDRPAQAWIMYLSGPPAACRKVRPWVSHFTLDAPRVGATGSGSKLKFAANHHVAILNVACAEMVALCRKMGLDPRVALQHMGHSPYLGTGLMRIRMPMMLDRRYQPATMKIGVWQKDMQIIGDMARDVDCPTPLLNASAGVYTAAMAMGLAEHDTAATAEVLATLSGQAPVKR